MEYELTNQWLKKANDDYISAKVLMEKVLPPQIEIVCYHCQQCIALDSGFSVLISDCARLIPYSVQTRYPNNIEIFESEAKAALIMAKKVYDFLADKIFGT